VFPLHGDEGVKHVVGTKDLAQRMVVGERRLLEMKRAFERIVPALDAGEVPRQSPGLGEHVRHRHRSEVGLLVGGEGMGRARGEPLTHDSDLLAVAELVASQLLEELTQLGVRGELERQPLIQLGAQRLGLEGEGEAGLYGGVLDHGGSSGAAETTRGPDYWGR
jgi:hypothetical protein